jgi:hypothetical protein
MRDNMEARYANIVSTSLCRRQGVKVSRRQGIKQLIGEAVGHVFILDDHCLTI